MEKSNAQTGQFKYFNSKVFKRLFLSYVLLIICFVTVYSGWYLISYSKQYGRDAEEACEQRVLALSTAMDRQLFDAQSMCDAVNASENCSAFFQRVYVEKTAPDSMQLYRMINEMRRIRAYSTNMSVYSLVLCLQGTQQVYMPGAVIDFEGEPQMLQNGESTRISTISRTLGVTNHLQVLFNKEYLIYARDYTGSVNKTTAKGVIMVLFDKSHLQKMVENLLESGQGGTLYYRGEAVLHAGQETGRTFETGSLLNDRLSYRLTVDERFFHASFLNEKLIPVALILLLGFMFILVTYFISRHFYQPLGSIGKMLDAGHEPDNEIDDLMDGIRSLIGERNGYREKMVTISPYVRQGMVHTLITGGTENQRSALLTDNEFLELKRSCFAVAIVNVVHMVEQRYAPQRYADIQALIQQVCNELSTEKLTIVCCAKNLQNMFVIVNSDEQDDMEKLFYTLHQRIGEEIDDASYAITIGVSGVESDLENLQSACEKAQSALNQMLLGGRDSVYFDDSSSLNRKRSYYFPRDTYKTMVKALHEGNPQDVYALLDDIYQRNVVETELPVEEIYMLIDELHYTIRSALQEVYDRLTIHVELQRVREIMTIDEIFAYYKTVFDTAMAQLNAQEPAGEAENMEQSVCDYIEAHIYAPDLSLNAIADYFGVSTKVIGAICKKRYQMTFLQYVRERQIHRAVELLQNSSMTLEDIAQRCGFTNVLTFRRNFKAVMNMNPSDFRK